MSFTSTPTTGDRSPGMKFLIMLAAGFLLSIPILSIYLLNYDRQSRSKEARESIAEGWGGAQRLAGPLLIIPYAVQETVNVEENGKQVAKVQLVRRELTIEPTSLTMQTKLNPERRKRSIYESVVYQAEHQGAARYVLPDDLEQSDSPLASLKFAQAELRFGLSDVQGLAGTTPVARIGGKALKLKAGADSLGQGFHGEFDASAIKSGELAADFAFGFRGNGMLTMAPKGTETTWTVTSPWQSPSFKGMLPITRNIDGKGFSATWKAGGLGLSGGGNTSSEEVYGDDRVADPDQAVNKSEARVDLFEPVDIYNQVDRATKYGFLFVGFTFIAFLMFDVIGGVRVSLIEYLLVGAGLVMFFVLLLAMAEVVGFGTAYALASGGIIGLITAYSAAVLKSWGRAKWIGGLLSGLYGTLYVLLSLEAYSLLIGSLLLFVALAGVMYLTRNIDWGQKKLGDTPEPLAPARVVAG
jgi:inner membrane protein